MAIEIALARYGSPEAADHVYSRARQNAPQDDWVSEVALVEMHQNGRVVLRGTFAGHFVSIDEYGDPDAGTVAGGAMTGAVVGALLGPAGFTGGLILGGMLGARVSSTGHEQEDGPLLEGLRRELKRRSSAILLLADSTLVDAMIAALEPAPEHVYRRALADEEVRELERSVADAPPAAPDSSS